MELKKIPGYDAHYWITPDGKVFTVSCGQLQEMRLSRVRQYARVGLRCNGRSRHVLVHRLVLHTYVGAPPFDRAEGIHLNNNPTDNRLSNLKWATHAENMRMDHGHNHAHKGERNRNSKLTEQQVRHVREVYKQARAAGHYCWGRKQLSQQYGVTEMQLGRIVKQHEGGWRHVES